MAYRTVPEFSRLPLIPLSQATVDAYEEITEKFYHVDEAGIAGLLNILPAQEHLERLMSGEAYTGTSDPNEAMKGILYGASQHEAEEAGISVQTAKQIKHLLASSTLFDRIRKSFSLADPTQKEAFLKIMPTNCHSELTSADTELFGSPDEKGKNALQK